MRTNRLKPGQLAPHFSVNDWQGHLIDLDQLQGNTVLLSFFRYASCPLCNLRVQELISKHERLTEKGITLVAVFQSPAERITRYVGRQAPPFPLVADPEMNLYRKYGVESSWKGFIRAWTMGIGKIIKTVIGRGFLPGTVEGDLNRIPADFLIGPDGILIDTYYGADIGDHMPLWRVFDGPEGKGTKSIDMRSVTGA